MKSRLFLGVMFSIMGLALLPACSLSLASSGEGQAVTATRGDLSVSINASGNIKASREVSLSFGTGGKLSKVAVKEGDTVRKGDLLAQQDTDALEMAVTQSGVEATRAKVALSKTELELSQAQLARQTAERELDAFKKSKSALDLALLNAQISTRNARKYLENTRDIYTWPDIETAQKEVDQAKSYIDYANERMAAANTTLAQEQWQTTLTYAQVRLETAQARLDSKVKSYDTEEVAIARLQVQAAEMAEAQAQKNIDEMASNISLKESQLKVAGETVRLAEASVGLAQQSAEASRRSLALSRKNLSEASISAPFEGTVARVGAREGDTVTPAMTIVHLVETSTPELVVEIDEMDVARIRIGQKAAISLDAMPERAFTGTVVSIFPLPKAATGLVTYNVRLRLDTAPDALIMVGMNAAAVIQVENRSNVLLIPSQAISRDKDGRAIVKVLVNGQQQTREIVIGAAAGTQTEVLGGLNEGERVVL